MAKGEAHQAARGGQPPGRVHMETGRWPCHHNLSYRSGSKVACGARRALQEAGRKAIGLKSKLGLDIGHVASACKGKECVRPGQLHG